MAILSIDAGTTGVTALLVDERGQILSRGYREFNQYFENDGWVEHAPEEIWQAVLQSCEAALSASSAQPTAIGITNQRETIAIWSRETLESPCRAIVWQDRRSTGEIAELKQFGFESLIREKTGLGLDPYFSASKLLWLSRHRSDVWSGVESGDYAVGTIDSYLIARLTGGAAHITDASNASRTQLFNLETLNWDDELLRIFKVPRHALANIVPSFGELAHTNPEHFLGISAVISGIAGDQQAALFGQLAFNVGDSKCTYGTGAFILQNTGSEVVRSDAGLLSTVAWMTPDRKTTYAIEGSVFVAGAAVQWLRDGLKIIDQASEVEALAASVPDSGGLTFVPALTGLGAPYWKPEVRGSILGINRGTTRGHIARATLEAIALQVRDVMITDRPLRVDGGATANNLLMQIQADVLGVPVQRRQVTESTGFGAALLAGLGAGIWQSTEELAGLNPIEREFVPAGFDGRVLDRWVRAVAASIEFSEE